jgi:thioredoxin reductase (NADPH)
LGVRHEQDFLGRGLSYCVECDATFFQDEDVAVVGEGSAAADGVLTMLHYAKTVHMISEKLQVADALREELEKSAAVLHEGVKVKEFVGEERISGLLLNNGETIPVRGVFAALGAKGVMELAGSLDIALDYDMKYIEVNRKQETSVPGIYAAGDICGLRSGGQGNRRGVRGRARGRRLCPPEGQGAGTDEEDGEGEERSACCKPTLELNL